MRAPTLLPIIGLALLSISQAVRAAEPSATNFARWEKIIAGFEEADRANPPPKDVLLFTGASSITYWSTLAQDFPQHHVLNRGFGGSLLVDVTHFASRFIFPVAPRAVYIRSGANDLKAGKSVEQVLADYKDCIATIRAGLPQTDIVFISLSPTIARWKQSDKEQALNGLIADYVKGKAHLGYIDVFDVVLGPDGQPRPELYLDDKLHFSAEGYKALAARVRSQLPK